MLTSYEKGPANRRLSGVRGFLTGETHSDRDVAGSTAAPEAGPLTRLFSRRWLVLLFAAIIFVLSVIYRLPWEAEAAALLAFAAGAALIPRFGISPAISPLAVPPWPPVEPFTMAALVIDALPEPAILLARDGAILSSNGKARDLFGAMKPGFHISSATRSPQLLEAIADCGPEKRQRTVNFSDRVPVERHMAVTVSYLEGQSSGGPSILVFFHDLTEQRRLDQLRADFIANASHEIKTPLASLIGFIETLQGAARHDEAARDRFLPIMAKQAERMARLIGNLMSLSRVEMRAHLKPQGLVTISELVGHACDALEPMASQANISVQVRSELDGVKVPGDRDELTQVFLNLVHNAIKYGRPGGCVSVNLQRRQDGPPGMIAVSVEDDGPGIAAQHLPRLTERFYRVSGSAAMEKGGTGLGLAIVKHVVNRHRGEFKISSKVGIGSKFTVILAEYIAPAESGGPRRD